MIPKTQSVCKHCGALANSPFHDESDPEGHKFEPVAEPVSTGEPPPASEWDQEYPRDNRFEPWPLAALAARPSEPSAPQGVANEEKETEKESTQAVSEFSAVRPVSRELPMRLTAPQTSAEPRKQCGCAHGDSDPYCPDPLCPNYIAAYHVKPPSPTPTEPRCPECKSLLTMDGNPPTPSGCSNENCQSATYPAAPSVAGTQPTRLAKLFHETYERLAPQFGYETRKESAKPWAEVPEKNKQLMIAVCAELFSGAAQGPPQVEEIASELLDAMETCHICHSYLILQEFPVHCADCSSDCENHDGDECTPIYVLHERLRKALQKRKHGVGAPAQPGPQTRFDDFDDAAHPFNIWWQKHGQFMMSGDGRKQFIWACRGWIAREQLAEGVEVTGDSMHESKPAPAQGTPEPPKVEEEKK